MKKITYFTMTAVTSFIIGFAAQASAPNQEQSKEFDEVYKAMRGIPSSKTLTDIVTSINDGKLICNMPDKDSNTIINYAFYIKNKEIVKACIAQCVKFGKCQEMAYPPTHRNILHLAAISSPELLKITLQDIPNIHDLIDQPDLEDATPLRRAIESFKVENVRILKEAGARLHLKSRNQTPLEYIKWYLAHPGVDNKDRAILNQMSEIINKGATEKLQ